MNYKFFTLVIVIGLLTFNVKAQNKEAEAVTKEAEEMREFLNKYAKSLKNQKKRSAPGSSADALDPMFINEDFRSSQIDSLRDEVHALSKKIDGLIPMIKEALSTSAMHPEKRTKIADKTLGSCNCVRVYFPFNSDAFDKGDTKSLDSLSAVWKKNKALKIKIDGHADRVGEKSANDLISKKRAQAAYTYLVKNNGVNPLSVSIDWLGSTKPHINTEDENLLWLNRRAEIYLQ